MPAITGNWSGHVNFAAHTQHHPTSLGQLQDVVRSARRVRAFGARHSFNAIADTDDTLISLRALPRLIAVDAASRTVRIDGGVTYAELCPALDTADFALRNLPSIPDFTVVGACATATHGSGTANQNLAAAVTSLDIVTASGDIVTFKRGDADFDGAVVNLGALGIVAAATLDVVPRYEARQNVYYDLSLETLIANVDAVMGAGYSVSLFTHWRGDVVDQLWVKTLADSSPPPTTLFGARAATGPTNPVHGPQASDGGGTPQMGSVGPWYQRIPHAMIGVMPRLGQELQTEYFVALSDGPAALSALRAITHMFAPVLVVSEVRTVAADTLWLSGSYERESLALHFAWTKDWPAVSGVLAAIETALAPFKPRPHWGKLFTMNGTDIQSRYPRLADFRALAARLDPGHKFRNAFVEQYLF